MCGIVGVISTLSKVKSPTYDMSICNAFDDMLWADQLRGIDGTGVMQLDKNGGLAVMKTAGNYEDFKAKKGSSALMNFVDTSVFTIGHNRSATKGVKDTDANAHPFVEGNVALVHNGTLTWVNHKFKHKEVKLDVDSRAAAKAINELGIHAAVNEMSGAYAFVWIDKEKLTLNVLRNDQRPLGFVRTGNYILIASEPSMAIWCASRNGVAFEPGTKIQPFEVNQLYTWEPETLEFSKEACERKYTHYSNSSYVESEYWDHHPTHGRVSSAPFHNSHFSGHYSSTGTHSSSKRNRTGSKERVRLLTTQSVECPYKPNEKVIFTVERGEEHKNLTRISSGEIIDPHIDCVDKHRITGNTPLKLIDICGEQQKLEGTISAIYKTDSGYFIFDLRDIVKYEAPTKPKSLPAISYCTPVASAVTPPIPKNDEQGKIIDLKSGDDMVECECCGSLTPESKLVTKKRSITNTESNVRIKMKFRVCSTCDVNMSKDETLMSNMTEKRLAITGGKLQ